MENNRERPQKKPSMMGFSQAFFQSIVSPSQTKPQPSKQEKEAPKDLNTTYQDIQGEFMQSFNQKIQSEESGQNQQSQHSSFFNQKIELPQLSDRTISIIQNEASNLLSQSMEKFSSRIIKKWVNKEGDDQVSKENKSPLSNIVEGILKDENIQDTIKDMAKTMKEEKTDEEESVSSETISELFNNPEVQKKMNEMIKNMTSKDGE